MDNDAKIVCLYIYMENDERPDVVYEWRLKLLAYAKSLMLPKRGYACVIERMDGEEE